ncbi:MAG TPA: ABC transporter permease [Anaerolineales bacterium]|nr:ABC transporter permease [Anaerolineales bacterium]
MTSNVWRIAREEFRRNVFRKSFILVLLSLPLMVGLNIGIVLVMEHLEKDTRPIGYVDLAGVMLVDVLPSDVSYNPVQFLAFNTEDEALEALMSEETQAFYVLSPEYLQTTEITLIYIEEPASSATRQFYDLLRVNLLNDVEPEIRERIAGGTEFLTRTPDGRRSFPSSGPTFQSVLPFFMGFALMMMVVMSAGFLLEGMIKERENRTLEVIVTSTSPGQLVTGKVLGILGISFTQITVWTLFGLAAVWIGNNSFGLAWFQDVSLEWEALLKVAVIGLPTFVMVSAFLFSMGCIMANGQEAQQIGGLSVAVSMLPFLAIAKIGAEPNGVLAVALSMLPFFSLMTVALRTIFIVIPLWQIIVSVGLQALFAIASIWFAGQVFRLSLLRYGKQLSLKEILTRVASARPAGVRS